MALRRNTPLKRSGWGLNRISPRRRSKARKEAAWRTAYLLDHPWCEAGPLLAEHDIPASAGCRVLAVELHERVKRSRGGSITDAENIVPICRWCHTWTESHPKVAQEIGLLASNPKWRTR